MQRTWIGFRVAKREGNHDKMKYNAESIQKYEKQLGLTDSTFSDILKEETENDLDDSTKLIKGDGAINEA